jgi:SAM-dependent methyltransferase
MDYVMIVDVLHHTEDPAALLSEACRVARHGVVIKDHLLEGFASGATLRLMDWLGNRGHDVALPYNYLSRSGWEGLFRRVGCTSLSWEEKLGLYPVPASLLFDRRLHFITLMAPDHSIAG